MPLNEADAAALTRIRAAETRAATDLRVMQLAFLHNPSARNYTAADRAMRQYQAAVQARRDFWTRVREEERHYASMAARLERLALGRARAL
jgi:hypothetical protein